VYRPYIAENNNNRPPHHYHWRN